MQKEPNFLSSQGFIKKKQKSDKLLYGLIGFIIAVLLITAVTAVVYLLQKNSDLAVPDVVPTVTPVVTPEVSDSPTATPAPEEEKLLTYISVKWEKEWIKEPGDCKDKNYCEAENYLAGKVLGGKYDGLNVYIRAELGLGTFYRHYIRENDTRLYFDENNIKIKGIDNLPAEIDFPGTGYKIKKNSIASTDFSQVKTVRKLFTEPELGDFYLSDSGCFVVELPDHTAITYDIVLPFVNKESAGFYGGKVDLTFINGKKNSEEYVFNEIKGCGALCYYLAVVSEKDLKPDTRLEKAGVTSNGEDIFKIKSSDDAVLKALYNEKNTFAYVYDENYQNPKNKYTYKEFISFNPLLYWKDPLGRWIQFKNSRFIPAAEMCKPVIYLYPQEKVSLNVKVDPNGGITYSNPLYSGGWNVEADPNGIIKDIRTGKKYDYLFWEGIGLNYPMENKGWAVKKENLSSFFDDKLFQLGLRDREIRDFKSYWLGRLTDKPYYRITFLDKEQFDEIAPLEVSPASPDRVIRVMMTAKGLEKNEDVPVQEIKEPAPRAGFTLVEWGGAVLK